MATILPLVFRHMAIATIRLSFDATTVVKATSAKYLRLLYSGSGDIGPIYSHQSRLEHRTVNSDRPPTRFPELVEGLPFILRPGAAHEEQSSPSTSSG
jgi:hypothetical protein